MSLFWNANDGVHLERVNAEQMAKRGIFVNVKAANDNRNRGEFGYQTPTAFDGGFFHLENENNLNSSPTRKRDAFTKAPFKKVNFQRDVDVPHRDAELDTLLSYTLSL